MVISILDDGIEKDHPDLWANYVSCLVIRQQARFPGWTDRCSWPRLTIIFLPLPAPLQDPLASYDFNDYDPDPQPRYTPNDENR